MANNVTNLEKVSNSIPQRDNYTQEDVNYNGLMSNVKPAKFKENISGIKPNHEMNKRLYNRDISNDPMSRAKNNPKRYGTAIYLGKDGNKDMYVKKEGGEGSDAYLMNSADSTSDGLERSNIADYSKQVGVNNAMKELYDLGVKMTSQINSFQSNDARFGGDNAVITVIPQDGMLTDEQRDTVIEVFKKHGVIQGNVSIVNQADIEKEPEAKSIFSKQHRVDEKDAVDMISGVKENKLSVPKVEKLDGKMTNSDYISKAIPVNLEHKNVKIDYKKVAEQHPTFDGKSVGHEKGTESEMMKRLAGNDESLLKHADIEKSLKSKNTSIKRDGDTLTLNDEENKNIITEKMRPEFIDAITTGKHAKNNSKKLSNKESDVKNDNDIDEKSTIRSRSKSKSRKSDDGMDDKMSEAPSKTSSRKQRGRKKN